MAEGRGFEPPVGLRLRLISSQVPLTTQPPFRICVVRTEFKTHAEIESKSVAHAVQAQRLGAQPGLTTDHGHETTLLGVMADRNLPIATFSNFGVASEWRIPVDSARRKC